jgi:hypothetical protein
LQPKPAYVAIQTLARQLSGYRLARRLPLPDDKDYALSLGSLEKDQLLYDRIKLGMR